MRSLLAWLTLAVLIAVATAMLGWWTVPVLGGLSGALMAAERRPVLFAGAAGAAGWAILLAGTALFGSVGVVATKVGAIFGLPGVVFIALALLFPALLAGSAAGVAGVAVAATTLLRRG